MSIITTECRGKGPIREHLESNVIVSPTKITQRDFFHSAMLQYCKPQDRDKRQTLGYNASICNVDSSSSKSQTGIVLPAGTTTNGM